VPAQTRPAAVEPFYFGEPPLYGCLHPGGGARRGVLICYPFGHEYITIHRAARLLATQTGRAGLPILRFDYSGTGDSAGNLEDARIEHWIRDIGLAADQLRARAAVDRLCLVGIRLGASLAYLAASQRNDIDSLALWDPIIWGRSYLRELKRDTRRMLRVAHVERRPQAGHSDREVLGFPLPERLESDLVELELDTARAPQVERILLVESQRAATAPLGANLRAAGRPVETRTEELRHLWRWNEDITKVQLPHAIVRAIAQWTAKGAA